MGDLEWLILISLMTVFGLIGWLWGITDFYDGYGRHGRLLRFATVLAVLSGMGLWVLTVLQ
ncbi:Uncharacterised protein [Mycobacteroides abscessus subsp. abscessus]|uniref:hypothetical protein n=1 Tax=Mycobacteroides abscessus TaxID=36809 RepID=UPI000925F576|nr:hypothetical protein [Mycobacteroides abscessus]SIH20763.1 Uncharacterised protein [Mycobacteroides abscessus subsp. abscessus]